MRIMHAPEEVIHAQSIPPGSRVYASGNAATPQVLLRQLAMDEEIRDIDLLSVLLLGDLELLFTESCCRRITHRVIFNGPLSRRAVNAGWARYQLMHLSDIPNQLEAHIRPDIVMLSVAGPDNGGNYSLGTTVEGVLAAVESARRLGGLVVAERNARMPFVLGTTIPGDAIDYLLDVDYAMPVSPVKSPDEDAKRVGELIARLYVKDGCTLQYGIGEVPEAVTGAILDKGVRDLGIHTELFADAMRTLVERGVVTNRYTASRERFSLASIFLSGSAEGYRWLHFNSSVQSRPCDQTNSVLNIAGQPNMVSVNSAIGVDLHGNIWADALRGRKIYSGVGGQADFLRGAYLSPGGVPIIAMKSMTAKGQSKILDQCPEGITTTAIAADPVIVVTEQGAFDPRGLSFTEHAVGMAHLAPPAERDDLLRHVFESGAFNNPRSALRRGKPKGFTPYADV
jgi:4-hydroxybutyrate CoA-transferase